MIKINITNETAELRAVVVGTAYDFGGTPSLEECYDPKSKEHVELGIFPCEKDCISAMDALVSVFKKYNVKVYRPQNIKGLNQIFSRDIAFAIGDKLVLPNIIEDRKGELEAIDIVLNQIKGLDKIKMPENARVEGGDVIVCNEYIFVGYSNEEDFENYTVARTNNAGLDFMTTTFPTKKVKGFELRKSDDISRENILHLDCCFQPIGSDIAIIYRDGFKNKADFYFLINYFGEENIIEITSDEMYYMNSNIFSISEKVIISEKGFLRLNTELRARGFTVEEVSYSEIAKMSGLFRCSTLPLMRA
jgi:N-dimethylarginine dimethylaminohydrolase